MYICGKIAHNAKYDYTILDRYNLRVFPITFDTMIGEWLTDPATKHKGLKDLAFHRLGIEMTNIVCYAPQLECFEKICYETHSCYKIYFPLKLASSYSTTAAITLVLMQCYSIATLVQQNPM